MSKVRFIGLDVHADTIAVAVAEPSGEVRSVGVIPNRPESIRKLVKKLGPVEPLRVCYEAGPTARGDRAAVDRMMRDNLVMSPAPSNAPVTPLLDVS